MKTKLLFILSMAILIGTANANTHYVDLSGTLSTGNNNGSSWTNAFQSWSALTSVGNTPTLTFPNTSQTAFFAAGSTTVTLTAANALINPGDNISGYGIPENTIVTEINGTTLTLDKSTTAAAGFLGDGIVDNIYIKGSFPTQTDTWTMSKDNYYGSFAGTETDPSQRATSDKDGNGIIESWEFTNPTTFPSTFNGVAITGSAAILDGFTITHTCAVDGAATMTTLNSPVGQTVQNCTFTGSVITLGATNTYTASNGGCLLKVLGTFKNNLVEKNTVTITTAVGSALKTYPILDVALPSTGTVSVVVSGSVFRNNIATIQQTATVSSQSFDSKGMILNVQHAVNPNASATFSDCIIHNNKALYNYVNSSSYNSNAQYNIAIAGVNLASGSTSTLSYINCLFANNYTKEGKSCMFIAPTTTKAIMKIYNCVFWNNKDYSTATAAAITIRGGALYSGSVVSNNVLNANYGSAPTGATTIANNLTDLSSSNTTATKGPQFVNPNTTIGASASFTSGDDLTAINHSDWRLNTGSYLIEKGSATGTALILPVANKDKAGNDFAATPTAGAYEFSSLTTVVNHSSESGSQIQVIKNGVIAKYQGDLEIISLTGTTLKMITVSNGQLINMPVGIYIVRTKSVEGVNTQKIAIF
jgi:hypothetical protein